MVADPLRVLLSGVRQPRERRTRHLGANTAPFADDEAGIEAVRDPRGVLSQPKSQQKVAARRRVVAHHGDISLSVDHGFSAQDNATTSSARPAGDVSESVPTSIPHKKRMRSSLPKHDDDEGDLMEELSKSLAGQACVARAMISIGAGTLTEVQKRAARLIVGENGQGGTDVIAVAPTGSGKTLCYVAPLCAYMEIYGANRKSAAGTSSRHTRRTSSAPTCVVLVPTRELAIQVGHVFTNLIEAGRQSLSVAVLASKAVMAGLASGASLDVLVATPQRCIAAMQRGVLDLGRVHHLVMDEADRLLDDGFLAQVDEVLAGCSSERRVHAFSATLPAHIEALILGLCDNAMKVVVGGGSYGGSAAVTDVAKSITQRFMFVGGKGEQGKVLAVQGLLRDGLMPPVLVFVQTKERAADLFRALIYDGVDVDAIHADRTDAARSAAISRFRAGKLHMLIATDLLARGLDFRAVATVVNYDFPSSASGYVHRIGRTGRNGKRGTAITLFTEEDADMLRPIAGIAKASGADVPEWMLRRPKKRADEVRRMETRPPKRRRVGGAAFRKARGKAVVPRSRDLEGTDSEDDAPDDVAESEESAGD